MQPSHDGDNNDDDDDDDDNDDDDRYVFAIVSCKLD